MSHRWCRVLAIVLGVCGGRLAAQDVADADPRWAQAAAWEAQGQWEQAIAVYDAIIADYPDSQKAVVRRGAARFEAGQLHQALSDVESGIALDPYSRVWAEWGYLYKARLCSRLDCAGEAREAIAILKARFPDSISTARAELVEGQMDARPTTAAERAIAWEEQAEALHDQANAASKAGDTEGALRLFDQVIADYPATRKSLRSMEIKAMLLGTLPDRTDETIEAWSDVLNRVGGAAPHSRIRYEAEFRLAALYQRQDQPREAMVAYLSLANLAQDGRVAMEAAFQAAGAHNELLQKRQGSGDSVSADEWETLRSHCRKVRQRKDATPFQRARMDLIVAESLYWQSRLEDALAAAEQVVGGYDRSVDRRGVATAHLIAGESLFFLHRYAEALPHFQWVVDEFGDEEIWGGLKDAYPHRTTHPAELARVHYDIFRTHEELGTDDETLAVLAEAYLQRFAQSKYAPVVRGWYGGYRYLRMHKR